MSSDRLLFIHIPKTGGTSIRQCIQHTLLSCDWGNPHLNALEYSRMLTPQLFDRLIKFSVVRNPYDRLLSYYFFMIRDKWHLDNITFPKTLPEYVKWACRGMVATQYSAVSIECRIAVNNIFKFEKLSEQWKEFASLYDLPSELPRLNCGKVLNYRRHLTSSLADEVYKSFEVDFKMFGYER